MDPCLAGTDSRQIAVLSKVSPVDPQHPHQLMVTILRAKTPKFHFIEKMVLTYAYSALHKAASSIVTGCFIQNGKNVHWL